MVYKIFECMSQYKIYRNVFCYPMTKLVMLHVSKDFVFFCFLNLCQGNYTAIEAIEHNGTLNNGLFQKYMYNLVKMK